MHMAKYNMLLAGLGLVGVSLKTMLDDRQKTQDGTAPWETLFL